MELKEGQKVRVKVSVKTAAGHAAGIEPGSARFTSTDESVASITPVDGDEMSADVEGLDGSNNESVTIEFRADGKRGEGVREVVAAGTVTVTQGDAVVADLEFGEVTDVEPAPEGGDVNGSETETIGSGDVGTMPDAITNGDTNPDEESIPGTLSGTSSGAGNEANQGVEANPSAGAGQGDAAGTTDADESNQPVDENAGPMTFDEAAADSAERNEDTPAGSETAVVDRVGDHAEQ